MKKVNAKWQAVIFQTNDDKINCKNLRLWVFGWGNTRRLFSHPRIDKKKKKKDKQEMYSHWESHQQEGQYFTVRTRIILFSKRRCDCFISSFTMFMHQNLLDLVANGQRVKADVYTSWLEGKWNKNIHWIYHSN